METTTQAKRGRGRPALDESEQLKARSLRTTDAEWQRWADAAAAAGQTQSAWVRDVVNRAAKRRLAGR